jgi:uncharacterized membrane protein YdfJ with MMPL/SSD domain
VTAVEIERELKRLDEQMGGADAASPAASARRANAAAQAFAAMNAARESALQAGAAGGAGTQRSLAESYFIALKTTGIAILYTALTLAVGVATWIFSDLKFQADMGMLLTFMFMVNMIMAMTFLPALAVMLDVVIPRVRPGRTPLLSH